MFKKIILLSASIVSFSTTFAAQTTSWNLQNTKQTPPPGAPIPPSDFANQVKATNTQKHTQFKQQLDQQKSALSHPQIPTLSQVQSMSQTPPPVITEESESSSKSLTTNTNKLKPNKPTTPTNNLLTPENNTQQSAPVTPPAANGGQTLPTPPAQNQPYTGFPQSQPSNSATPKNNGGFNIQY